MSFSFDLSNNIGKVRNLIGDDTQSSALFTDESINSFLSITGNDLFATAAMCCRRIATNKALLAKKRTAGNFSEDTSFLYKAYLDMAKEFEQNSRDIPADAQSEEILNDFQFNNVLQNRIMRGESLDD